MPTSKILSRGSKNKEEAVFSSDPGVISTSDYRRAAGLSIQSGLVTGWVNAWSSRLNRSPPHLQPSARRYHHRVGHH